MRGEDGARGPAAPLETNLHASCVALEGRAVLISGASGTGKSSLALQLMGFGARLVADDRTVVRLRGNRLWASAPDSIRGKIEARGVGILKATALREAEVVLAVDLDRKETDRLPHPLETRILGEPLPLCLRVDAAHFAAAILQFLREGRDA
ncbi:HPr kinase/phosphorylase [Shimia haliotis]|uniref:HPr kinase/phosphorylase n=1 Tax=Shimia haliotis TaxID=1280847 RepID=A0A1I4FRY9_9RHOB|nr:HPr kinase/phosphatase C-terminal domain-containing protein [Shimia haliotis]SFL20050.1 HPr kinase/phosphorylase [Shimia haliotis]